MIKNGMIENVSWCKNIFQEFRPKNEHKILKFSISPLVFGQNDFTFSFII